MNFSSGKISWGVGFGHFCLQATDTSLLTQARQVLEPWLGDAAGELLGRWEAVPARDGWKLLSPAVLRPLLDDWGVPQDSLSAQALIKAVEFQATAVAILHPGSPLGMHGALLDSRGQGIALVGEKQAGKSTLGATLWQAGFKLLSDDGFFLHEGSFGARPVPRRSRLRGDSQRHFPSTFWSELAERSTSFTDNDGSLLFHPMTDSKGTTLKAIVLLSAQAGPLERLCPSDALVDLVRHTYRFVVSGAPASMRQLSPLTQRVACYRMGRAALDEQLRRVKEILG